ncbi:hypothetical protein BDV38DRAFT_39848 [Aspergillus pseudotamarii]|uniref:SET domain-containing protein n=1 Tax=Aspergillus pseudotamarii TaxID=132259 RepID=A0A5N6SYI3_ASPPS|nr:uncharacterized protein BDV38DRAFT_39848 [Aspergillus pseudotamarii]KAE8139738.1 hypothetical protein BDV38DRAFT_39848 [Aspergillus pseudotamarii]
MSPLGQVSLNHPYRRLKIPRNVPLELRPSLGQGWGAFATRRIERGSRILSEKPLFIIRKPHTDITEEHVRMAFQELSPSQQAEVLLLRDNGSMAFPSLNQAFAENSFCITTADPDRPPAYGLFPLHSRFNHSCIPNSKIPVTKGETISIFATRNIDAGEEITFCYESDFECRTRYERHEALRFTCNCMACLPGTPFQQLSDMRRRLIRGLQYLTLGVDINGQRQSSHSSIIVDSELRNAAETFSIPISCRFIYTLLTIFLIEEEGLLDDFLVERLRPGLVATAGLFTLESNCSIARLAMNQGSWLERLLVGFELYGRRDTADHEVILALQKVRLVT